MLCDYCGKNTATVEVDINEDECIHLCWFCSQRKEDIIECCECENCCETDYVSSRGLESTEYSCISTERREIDCPEEMSCVHAVKGKPEIEVIRI